MRCRVRAFFRAAVLAALFAAAGCSGSVEEVSIPPESEQAGSANLDLGPGVRPLSFGPGDKSSPRWGPSEKRIAFVVDGYVVDKQPESRDFQRRTTRDFGAESVEWISSGKELAILGQSLSKIPSAKGNTGFVYRTDSAEESLGIAAVADAALAMDKSPDGEELLIARKTGPSESGLAAAREDGWLRKIYDGSIEGTVTGLSVSPDGRKALLAVRSPGKAPSFRLCVFDFREESVTRTYHLDGKRILGAPQQTGGSIYYMAGEADPESGNSTAYRLYRIPASGGSQELAPGVGRSFLASSLRASPGGNKLAVIGRRNRGSPDNVYVLHPRENRLESLTENENMEIKSGPGDLAWSPNGRSVAIVARGVLTGPEVHTGPADGLLRDFYNVYEVPAVKSAEGRREEAG